jgi:hypothetical protein
VFWLGAPTLLRMRQRFDGRLPSDRFDRIIERIRERTHDSGVVERMSESLVFSSSERHPIQPHLMIRLVVTNAARTKDEWFTTLTIMDRLDALAGRLFGTFGGIVGAGGLAAPVAASLALPPLAPVFVFTWLGGVYGTSRFLYRKAARQRAAILHSTFGLLVEDLEALLE